MFELLVRFVDFIDYSRYFTQGIGEHSAGQNDNSNREYSLLQSLGRDVPVAHGEHGDDGPVETGDIHEELISLIVVIKKHPTMLLVAVFIYGQQVEETAAEIGQVEDLDHEFGEVEKVHVEALKGDNKFADLVDHRKEVEQVDLLEKYYIVLSLV